MVTPTVSRLVSPAVTGFGVNRASVSLGASVAASAMSFTNPATGEVVTVKTAVSGRHMASSDGVTDREKGLSWRQL